MGLRFFGVCVKVFLCWVLWFTVVAVFCFILVIRWFWGFLAVLSLQGVGIIYLIG